MTYFFEKYAELIVFISTFGLELLLTPHEETAKRVISRKWSKII